jgi:uncharacterized protein with HEPN domain
MHLSQVEFLRHILDECRYLRKESEENSFDDFVQNERLSKAVCRSLEIIGEASNKLTPDLKISNPQVPWREITDIRNRIIHHYFGIDYDIVWNTVTTDIPQLQEATQDIINRLP